MVRCIYCKAENATSLSHIIPESLGNNVTLKTGVCDECNSVFNQEVEEPIVKALTPIRSFFQLMGKRGELPLLRVEVRYGSGRQYVDAKSLSELLSRVFVFTNFTDPAGALRNIAFISFDRNAVEQHRQRYLARHPEAPISEVPQETLSGLEFWVNFDFGVFADPRCLRMVAKIAFEWWCRERSPEFVASEEYDEVRNYIRYGAEPTQPVVSVDGGVVSGYFRNTPFGAHMLYRRLHPRLGSMVMIVAPYSLVYYRVVLTRRFRALASDWALTFVNPQTGDPYSPRIINPRGKVLTVSDVVQPECVNAAEVIGHLTPALLDRLNEGMRVILEQNRNRLGAEAIGSAE